MLRAGHDAPRAPGVRVPRRNHQRQKLLLAQDHKLSKEDMQLCSCHTTGPGTWLHSSSGPRTCRTARCTNHLKAVVEGKNDALW